MQHALLSYDHHDVSLNLKSNRNTVISVTLVLRMFHAYAVTMTVDFKFKYLCLPLFSESANVSNRLHGSLIPEASSFNLTPEASGLRCSPTPSRKPKRFLKAYPRKP